MKDWIAAAFVIGLVAVLIPYPGLLPVSIVALAAIWLATPTSLSKPRRRAAKPQEARGTSESR